MSQKAGDNVRIAVTGTDQSLLGFKGSTVAAEGKDTTFEIGYDFHTNTIDPVETTHKNFDLTGTAYTFFVNGKEITVNKPATQITNTPTAGIPFGVQNVELNINGKTVTIPASDFNNAPAKAVYLNEKLREAGLGGEAVIQNLTFNGNTYDFDLTTTTPSKKELEFAFDEALRKAGFDLKWE